MPAAVLTLVDNQKVPVSVSAVDAKGQPATIPTGAVAFTSADPTVAAVTDNGDGTATLTAGNEGSTQVAATLTPSDGSPAVVGQLSVTVIGGQAVSLAINAGTPTNQ